jgi:transposase InsO family protein
LPTSRSEIRLHPAANESLSDYIFTTRKASQARVIDYIGDYNGIRLHSTLGYQPPVIYEKELYRNAA